MGPSNSTFSNAGDIVNGRSLSVTIRGRNGRQVVKLKTREKDGVVIVDVGGQLRGGPDSDKFHDFFKTMIDEGHKKVVVNLRKVPWVDSRGLGMLIGAHTSLAAAGGDLVLSNVTDRITSILAITRLALIFQEFDTEEEAVAHLLKEE